MKKLSSILGNSQWLDGGAMFGNVPQTLWSKWHIPNENNQIQLATRALLIQDNNTNILLEAGVGAFFSPKMGAKRAAGSFIHCEKHTAFHTSDIVCRHGLAPTSTAFTSG